MNSLRHYLTRAFYFSALALTLLSFEPNTQQLHPGLIQGLLEGKQTLYIEPGSEMKVFRSGLPDQGAVSFLTEKSFRESPVETQKIYLKAQNYLCPLIVTDQPGQGQGVLFTENEAAGQKRLAETGYRMVSQVAEGKGLIERIP